MSFRCLTVVLLATLAGRLPVQAGTFPMATVRVVDGLFHPVWVTAPPNDFHRIFVLEQPGRIRIVKDGQLLATSFLDIDPIVLGGTSLTDERGLLGLAFHPDFATNGYFYIYYVALNNSVNVVRYHVSEDPDLADPNSALPILNLVEPNFPNHKCGWTVFGPDGYMYIGVGDGGSANDPGNRAQDITDQRLGKLLRIDINSDDFPEDTAKNYAIPPTNPFVGIDGDDEIWAYGLRNPWRNSFDALTGDLFIADVGQDHEEEINIQPASSTGGENYGWRCMEGLLCTGLTGCTCNDPALKLPVYVYDHTALPIVRCSITGGEVYRGCAIPQLQGVYFFAEYCSDEIYTLERTDDGVAVNEVSAQLAPGGGLNIKGISSFGHDAYGEMYICDRDDGEVFKIVPMPFVPDCNMNDRIDACDLLDGSSVDRDMSGVPDECEVPLSIVSSEPPAESVDARQPFPINGGTGQGWNAFDVTFNNVSVSVVATDFSITQQGGAGVPPSIIGVAPLSDFTIRVFLSGPINDSAWTTLTYTPSVTSVRLGFLPGDVNGDHISTPVDILALIDTLNGIGNPRPIWSTDIDRSGMANPADILREIDLLNGADAYPVYNGAALP